MKLFNFKKKQNSKGQNLDKLVDGELPWGWVIYFKDFYKPRNDKMVELAMKTHSKDKDEKISALKELIAYFYAYKKECSEKGECFEKYFDNEWMHCLNNQNKDFIYITPYEEELERMI